MNQIGRQVSLLATGENNPRNGEGTFIRRRDNTILYAYSRYTGNNWDDHAAADIAGILSCDEGETWGEPFIILRHDEMSSNYMCPSLIRMHNGDLGLVYLRKYRNRDASAVGLQEAMLDTICFVRSADEGNTWSEPVVCTTEPVYDVIENDHAQILQYQTDANNGRILIPVNRHSVWTDGTLRNSGYGRMFFIASDDDGRTFRTISDMYGICNAPYSATGLQETVIYEEKTGCLRAFSRTDQLCQYECFSSDGGAVWTENHPIPFFSSAVSPMNIRRACGLTAAVFNPIPLYTARDTVGVWGRTPLVCAVSEDDGKTFPRIYAIEDDPHNGYCYPSIFDGGDYMLVGYYHSNHTGIVLNANKIVKINKEELYT
ncbi:MAG: sialidase family protein [Eubacteriales bacterium]